MACWLDAPYVPVIVAVVVVTTGNVVTINVAVVAPAAIVKFDGVTALALFEARVTNAPPAGAGAASVTVPVDAIPPATEVGDMVRLANPVPVTLRT